MVFEHKVCGPLEIFHEMLETGRGGDANVGEFVEDLRKKLSRTWRFARENLASSQAAMKLNFDRKSEARSFEPGELVLVLNLFQNSPSRTNFLEHDVDVGNASPVKPSPYRLNPVKRDIVDKEIKYMLEHDLIQPSGIGMKNAACTFQRLMNRVICGLEGTEIYIDDLVVHSNDWRTHILRLSKVFEELRAAGLVVNLAKCEFDKA
ncbi:uncharacterized protein LOC135222376 [Macrobrachium nipponense]|uniref:uncharacterized protein LOC135222376 n=1 Tax=Macrobrachium nipponense TaxID=159736 RepID=UPI0030C7F533